MRSIVVAVGIVVLLTLGVAAEDAPAKALHDEDPLTVADTAGTMAGNAIFCDIDSETFEDFVIRASEAIQQQSPDSDATAKATERFAAAMDAASQNGPKDKNCAAFLEAFKAAHEELKQAGY